MLPEELNARLAGISYTPNLSLVDASQFLLFGDLVKVIE